MSESNLEMEVFFRFSTVKKERDGVSLDFGIAGPGGRPARRAISSVVERAPDNCVVVPGLWGDSGEIQCRSNFLFTRGIRAIRGGPPRLLSSREFIHPLSVYGQLSLEHRFRFGLNGKIKTEHLTTYLHRPRTTRSPLSFWGDGRIVPFEPFFHAFPGGLEKLADK
ncbi:hypothetical protein VNO78_38364 [Psophocarpus tetragonolobus]|uniref:Uncharacterized protein ycf68 n=1 Tax=Psophocarpus tetragonolobus TaxID=3891 RepID=A0AAN9N3S7_PSOTE